MLYNEIPLIKELKSSQLIIKILQEEINSTSIGPKTEDNLIHTIPTIINSQTSNKEISKTLNQRTVVQKGIRRNTPKMTTTVALRKHKILILEIAMLEVYQIRLGTSLMTLLVCLAL